MQGFVTIPNIKSDKDIRVLQRLYDEVKTSVRNLKVETSTYGSLLVPLLIEKIPNDLRIRLLEFGIGNLNEMLDFLKLEVEAKEKFAAIGTAGTFSNQKYSQSYDKFTTAALNKSTHKNKPYVYCNFTNTLSHMCLKVTNIGQRKSILKTKNLCYICLDSRHVAKQCTLNYICKKCNSKHHISICNFEKGFNLNKQQNGSTTSNFSNRQNSILLQAAFAEVSDLTQQTKANVNILFHSGSQRTYISSELRKRLKLQTLRTKRIFIKSFGNKSFSVTTVDIVTLKIINPQKIVAIHTVTVF